MKTLSVTFFLAVCFSLAAGCCDSQQNALLAANKALVMRTHDEVWSKGNFDLIDELYSPDYIAHRAADESQESTLLAGSVIG